MARKRRWRDQRKCETSKKSCITSDFIHNPLKAIISSTREKPAHWFIFSSTLKAQSEFSKKLPETRGQVKSLNCLLTVQTTLLFDTVAIMSLKNLVDYLYSLFKLQTTNFKFSYIFQWSGRGVPHAILTLIISFLTIEKQNMINDILHSLPSTSPHIFKFCTFATYGL